MKEAELQNQILEYLVDIKGLFFWRNNNTPVYDVTRKTFRRMPKYSRHGIPDILGVYKGYFVGMEVKVTNGRPSSFQKEFIGRCKTAGGICGVVRSIEDAQELLDKVK